MRRRCVIFLVGICLPAMLSAGNGDPPGADNGFPDWRERAALTVTNMVRVAPAAYRDTYLGDYQILLPATYPAVDPLYYDPDLHQAAHDHSVDMAENCGMTHSSCDGTYWSDRIESYYTPGYPIAENIATGNADPQATVRQWLMDLDTTRTIPAPDGQDADAQFPSGDGHRKNIMNGQLTVMGNGYAYNGSRPWYHFWTQDFGGKTSPDAAHPVASGSHLFMESGKTSFIAVYAGGDTPQAAQVAIDGTVQDMALHLGTAGRGAWIYTGTEAADCRRYRFIFTGAGGTVSRYPENGDLVTCGEGSCAEVYRTPSAVTAGIPAAVGEGYRMFFTGSSLRIQLPPGAVRPQTMLLYTPAGRMIGRYILTDQNTDIACPLAAPGPVLAAFPRSCAPATILKTLYLQ